MVAELDAALTRAEQDPDIAAIAITGSDPAFCAGLDIREFNATGRPPAGVSELILRVPTLTKPTIGALNGAVATGGLELALGIDILIASERATFSDTHAKVGILPGGGMTARLPRAVGPAWPWRCRSPAGCSMPPRPCATDWSRTSSRTSG